MGKKKSKHRSRGELLQMLNPLLPELAVLPPKVVVFEKYVITYLTPENNTMTALFLTGKVVVSLSGGVGSAIAAEIIIRQLGRENVILWFADVLGEDPDLYRYLHDLMKRWGGMLYWYTDGRHPHEVWEEKKIIPNSMIAPCTYELKIKPYRDFILAMPELPTVVIGFKPKEKKRQLNCRISYKEAIPEAVVEYPVVDHPWGERDLCDVSREELGVEPPLTYALGFDYCNCIEDGGCCRSGKRTWIQVLKYNPEGFRKRAEWEQKARSWSPIYANRSFYATKLKGNEHKTPITLLEIEQAYELFKQKGLHTPVESDEEEEIVDY